jgi:putative membrane protein
MNRMILSLLLVVAAGTAVAQHGSASSAANPLPDSQAATAQRRIEQDGYTDVQNLAKGPDGLWRGTALRDGKQVQVTVDRSGNVIAK